MKFLKKEKREAGKRKPPRRLIFGIKCNVTFLKKKLKPLEFTDYLDVNCSICEFNDYLTWVELCIKMLILSKDHEVRIMK